MLNKSNNGIICDYCSDGVDGDFVYYSFDFYCIDVVNRVKQISNRVSLSVDLCEDCMEAYRDRVKKAYRPSISNTFNCDVSGNVVTAPTFTYYRCVITKVEVAISGRPYVCMSCGDPRSLEDGKCLKCPSETLIQRADIVTDDKYLELNMCDLVYGKFVEHITSRKGLINV